MKTLSYPDIQHFLYRGELQQALQEVQNYLFLVSRQVQVNLPMLHEEGRGVLSWLEHFSALQKHQKKIDTLGISIFINKVPQLYAFAYCDTGYNKYNEDWLKDFDYFYDTPYFLPIEVAIEKQACAAFMGNYAQPKQLRVVLYFLRLCEGLAYLHAQSIIQEHILGKVNLVILGDMPPFTFFSPCPGYINTKLTLCQ